MARPQTHGPPDWARLRIQAKIEELQDCVKCYTSSDLGPLRHAFRCIQDLPVGDTEANSAILDACTQLLSTRMPPFLRAELIFVKSAVLSQTWKLQEARKELEEAYRLFKSVKKESDEADGKIDDGYEQRMKTDGDDIETWIKSCERILSDTQGDEPECHFWGRFFDPEESWEPRMKLKITRLPMPLPGQVVDRAKGPTIRLVAAKKEAIEVTEDFAEDGKE